MGARQRIGGSPMPPPREGARRAHRARTTAETAGIPAGPAEPAQEERPSLENGARRHSAVPMVEVLVRPALLVGGPMAYLGRKRSQGRLGAGHLERAMVGSTSQQGSAPAGHLASERTNERREPTRDWAAGPPGAPVLVFPPPRAASDWPDAPVAIPPPTLTWAFCSARAPLGQVALALPSAQRAPPGPGTAPMPVQVPMPVLVPAPALVPAGVPIPMPMLVLVLVLASWTPRPPVPANLARQASAPTLLQAMRATRVSRRPAPDQLVGARAGIGPTPPQPMARALAQARPAPQRAQPAAPFQAQPVPAQAQPG